MTTQALPDLDQLTNTYDIVGELAGRDDARMYLARRREDGLDVLIVVAHVVASDEGNALSHLAADANLLTSLTHRSVLPVVDGRWVGGDAFAVVLKRTSAPTLAELLNRREEEFDYPRIAAILRETNGVLEWARAQKVVHRVVRPETLYVEPGTDRVQVSFAVTPLPASGVPGMERDGATIAALARAMLTRSPAAPEREAQPLGELRPGLPAVLLEETEQLLHPDPSPATRDVSGYIARIAMADALKTAQDKLEESRNLIERQEAEHKAQLEKERAEHDAQIATERKAHDEQVLNERKQHDREMEAARREHERVVAEQARQFQREREQHAKEAADQQREFEKRVAEQQRQFEKQVAEQQRQFEKQVADEQKRFERQRSEQQKELQRERDEHAKLVAQQTKQLQREREEHERRVAEQARKFQKEREGFDRELAKQREALERERQALAAERAAHARDRAALLEERALHEQISREERDRLASDAAALASQADMYAHAAEPPAVDDELEVRLPRHVEREVEPPAMPDRDDDDLADAPSPRAGFEAPPAVVPPPESRRSLHDRVIAPLAAWLASAWAKRPVMSGRPRWDRRWNVPAAAVALVLLIGITVFALSRSGGERPRTAVTSPSAARFVDSAGGNVYESIVPLPRVETDTGVLSARATDWTPPPRRRSAPQAQREPERAQAPPPVEQSVADPAADFLGIARPPMDSARPGLPIPTTPNRAPVRRDSAPRDSVRGPVTLPFGIPLPPVVRRDSLPRPDTAVRRDSTGLRR